MGIHADNLIAALRAKQTERGLSDRGFAAFLGVHPSMWNRTRRGLMPISDRMIDAITSRCSDLKPELDLFLRERATIRNSMKAHPQQEATR